MTNKWIKVRNWDRWQSYRSDRHQPPWIKLHRCVMRNLEWVDLTDAQRGQLVALWLLAADHGGMIPASPEAVRKLAGMDSVPDLNLFARLGFLESGAKVTPGRRQTDANVTHQTRLDKTRLEETRQELCAEPVEDDHSAPPAPPIILTIPLANGEEGPVTADMVAEWQAAYPGVDVLASCRKARVWCIDNPTKRKTARGYRRFLGAWLGREQDRGGQAPALTGRAAALASQAERLKQLEAESVPHE